MAEKWTNTSSPSGRSMNPYPFSLLNHLTVPCVNPVPPCHDRPPSAGDGAEPSMGSSPPQRILARGRARLPFGFEGASVLVLQPERVVLGGVPVGDLQDPAAPFPAVRDPMGLLGGDHELFAEPRLDHPVADLDHQALVPDHPHLVAELMVVLAGGLPGVDRDHPDRRRLVQRV